MAVKVPGTKSTEAERDELAAAVPDDPAVLKAALPEGFVPAANPVVSAKGTPSEEVLEGLTPDAKAPLPEGFRPQAEAGGLPAGFRPVGKETDGMFDSLMEGAQDLTMDAMYSIGSRVMGTDVQDPMAMERLTGQLVGGVGGAIFGTTLAGSIPVLAPLAPVAGALGGAVGVMAGTIAPEATLELGEFLGFVPDGYREEFALSNAELLTVVKGEALLEVATGGGLIAARALWRGGSRLFMGISPEVMDLATRAEARGIALMPVMVGDSALPRGFVFVMGRIPWMGGAKIRKVVEAGGKQVQGFIEGMPTRIAPVSAWNEVAEGMWASSRELLKDFNQTMSTKYNKVWAEAEKLGVTVSPKSVLEEADRIVGELAKKSQTIVKEVRLKDGSIKRTEVKAPASEALQPIIDFMQREILPMRGKETGRVAGQTFKQMDGLLQKLEDMFSHLDPVTAKYARLHLNDLKQAIQYDSVSNTMGAAARQVGQQLSDLDAEFSKILTQVFQNSTALKFGTVNKSGIRATQDVATRVPVDELARYVAQNVTSPQVVKELHGLIGPAQFKKMTATYLQAAVDKVMKPKADGTGHFFDANAFAKALGMTSKTSPTKQAITEMLDLAGEGVEGAMKYGDLEEMIEITRALGNVDVPNMSVFLARKATLGSITGLAKAVLPGALMASAGGAMLPTGMLLTVATIVGSKGIMKMITNPKHLKEWKTIMGQGPAFVGKNINSEQSIIMRRLAYVKLLQLTIESAKPEGPKVRTPEGRLKIQTKKYQDLLTEIGETMLDEMDNVAEMTRINIGQVAEEGPEK